MRRPTLLLALAVTCAPADALAHLIDREVRPPVNYYTLVPPAAGQSYIDPVFGTEIRRLSDARQSPNAAHVGNLAFIVNEYSTMSPFNQDDSRLLLQHQSYFGLYDGEGRYLEDLPFDIAASTEPRWSRQDPNLVYYVYGNSLKSYNVATRARSVVHAFTEYGRIGGRGESDVCFDGDHLVLVGDDRDVFVYTLRTDTKGPVLDTTGHGFDSLYLTPDDQVIVAWNQTGSARFAGSELFDRDLRFLRQLTTVNGHKDVGRDTDGQAVLFWINAADPQAPPDCQNAVVKIRLADGQRTCLLPLDWGLAVHISAPDSGAWFVVSTFAPGDPDPRLAGWRPYTDEILQVRVDGSEVRRLAHHRSRPFNDYWYTPRAAVSRDGRRLVFSSNHGLPAILGYGSYNVDAYMVDLDAVAPASAGSPLPIRTRYEQDDAAVSYAGPWYSSAVYLHSGGSASAAMNAGSRATMSFTGTSVRWIGYRDEWSGIARVHLDGELRSTVDTYSTPYRPQSVLFSAGDLAPGPHALEVEATGTGSTGSGGSWVWLDAFEVQARTEQEATEATYSGGWESISLAAHSGHSAARTSDPGARVDFAFMGTAVSWIGYRDGLCGIARVAVDDVVRAEIDTYAPTPEAQAVVYTLSGLPPGEHTLTLEATGQRHPLSLGDWIWVDGFETRPE